MNQAVTKPCFKAGEVVTVTNEKDIMYGLQGEVDYSFFDDHESFANLVLVRFHKAIAGPRGQGLRLVGDYYEGIKSSKGPMTFTYQDRSPEGSSIRLDPDGYTEENKRKIQLG